MCTTFKYNIPHCAPKLCITYHNVYHSYVQYTTLCTKVMYNIPQCGPKVCMIYHKVYHNYVQYTTLCTKVMYTIPQCVPKLCIFPASYLLKYDYTSWVTPPCTSSPLALISSPLAYSALEWANINTLFSFFFNNHFSL